MKTKLFLLPLLGILAMGLTAHAQFLPIKSNKATAYAKNSAGEVWYPSIKDGDKDHMHNYFSSNKLTDEQLEALNVRSLKHNFLKSAPADRIIAGETLCDTDHGKAVVLHAYQDDPDGNDFRYLYDYLVTYDKAGNYIDSKLIGRTGLMGSYTDFQMKYWVDGDTNTLYTEEDMGGESEVLPYNVNQAMKIVRKK